jgi:hypothetical protein
VNADVLPSVVSMCTLLFDVPVVASVTFHAARNVTYGTAGKDLFVIET